MIVVPADLTKQAREGVNRRKSNSFAGSRVTQPLSAPLDRRRDDTATVQHRGNAVLHPAYARARYVATSRSVSRVSNRSAHRASIGALPTRCPAGGDRFPLVCERYCVARVSDVTEHVAFRLAHENDGFTNGIDGAPAPTQVDIAVGPGRTSPIGSATSS